MHIADLHSDSKTHRMSGKVHSMSRGAFAAKKEGEQRLDDTKGGCHFKSHTFNHHMYDPGDLPS